MLKIICELPERDKYGNVLVKCLCSHCSSMVIKRKSQISLLNSCGCRKGNRRVNRFNTVDDITEIFDFKGNSCIIDTNDLERVSKYYWYQDSRGYWMHHISRNKNIYLHKFIMGVEYDNKILVDHINHNTCDNRKSELRTCSIIENLRNRNLKKKNHTGHVGVYKTSSNKYKALIFIHGKELRLGVFDTIEEAVQVRHNAEKKYYGEFRGGRYV